MFRYIHSGRLKAAKIGYWRISDKDLKNFLEVNANLRKKGETIARTKLQ